MVEQLHGLLLQEQVFEESPQGAKGIQRSRQVQPQLHLNELHQEGVQVQLIFVEEREGIDLGDDAGLHLRRD